MFLSRQRQIWREIRAYLIISFGLLIYSFAWAGFLIPAKVVGGGSSGIGMLIFYATGGDNGGIPVGISYFVINAILLGIGTLVIGPKFGIKTIYAIIFTSISLTALQETIPPDLMGLSADRLLSAILGGAVAGAGIGICFTQGGSSGGTDIVAMIINKYRNVSLGKMIMLQDIIIVGCAYFVFKDIASIVYGYVTMVGVGYTIDVVLSGSKQSAQIMVFSKHYGEIAEAITTQANRGVTLLDGMGWYSKSPQKIVLVVCRRNESGVIYRIIKDCDPDAFITTGSVMGVFGKGFEALNKKTVKKPRKSTILQVERRKS